MNNIGGQELCLSAVGRKNLWEATGIKRLLFIDWKISIYFV